MGERQVKLWNPEAERMRKIGSSHSHIFGDGVGGAVAIVEIIVAIKVVKSLQLGV